MGYVSDQAIIENSSIVRLRYAMTDTFCQSGSKEGRKEGL